MADNVIREAEVRGTIDYTRGRDWFDPSETNAIVTIVGCGGIGSPTALALAKLGIARINLVDMDVVDKHNLPNQLFPLTDIVGDAADSTIGRPKVDMLADTLAAFAVSEVKAHNCRLEEMNVLPGVVIGALDSMAAREALWEKVKSNIRTPFFIDARLGGESIVVYTCNPRNPDERERYEATLHSDEEASEAPCTRRSIIDVGFVVASLITRAVRRHYAGEQPEHALFWNHASLRATVGRDDQGQADH